MLALWRFDQQGRLAEGFPALWRPDPGDSIGLSSAIDAQGSVWVAGQYHEVGRPETLGLWKFNGDGSLEDGFPVSGAQDLNDQRLTSGFDVEVGQSGEIWVCGWLREPRGRKDMALWRFDGNGRVVDGFPIVRNGDAGGDGHDVARALSIDAEGAVWVVGTSTGLRSGLDLMLWKFDSRGEAVEGFPTVWRGLDGAAVDDIAHAVAIDDRGLVWVAGRVHDAQRNSDFALWAFR